MRSPQRLGASPIETQTSVYRKSHPRIAASTFSVRVIRAPVSLAMARAREMRAAPGQHDFGPARRMSMPMLAAAIMRESAVLQPASPREHEETDSRGFRS